MTLADGRYVRRIARLEAVGILDADACAAMTDAHQSGRRPSKIWLRGSFARRDEPYRGHVRTAPPRGRRPPAARLIHSRGIALQLLLAALFEAQCRTRPGRRPRVNARPLSPPPATGSRREYGWVELVGACTGVTTGASKPGSTPLARRLRQVRRALANLAAPDLGLITFADPTVGRGRYEVFRLSHESGRRRGGDPLPYAVPRSTDHGLFGLDTRLFTNGWLHALEDSELAFLCMLADLHTRLADRWVSISEADRVAFYGLGPDAYRAHQLLTRAGVIDIDRPEGRREDGTFTDYTDPLWGGSGAPPHRFHLREDAFSEPARPVVVDALKQLVTSAVPAAATRRRIHWWPRAPQRRS